MAYTPPSSSSITISFSGSYTPPASTAIAIDMAAPDDSGPQQAVQVAAMLFFAL